VRLDVLICTNLVNLSVAWRGARPGQSRRALLLYEPWRFALPVWPRVLSRPIGIWAWRALRLIAALRLIDTLYLPHDRFNWRVAWCVVRARRVVYLDDGLDTRRLAPVNFDLQRASPAAVYLTFDEYRELPPWLARFDVRRVGSIVALAQIAPRPLLPLDGASHVFVESPGLDIAAVVAALGVPASQVLVVRHPVPAKRAALPAGLRQVEGAAYGIEATLLDSRGLTWCFGETMALVFAVLAAGSRQHRFLAQVPAAQRANLVGFDWRPAGIPLPDLVELTA
jgi:hypothetical protein